MTQKGAWQKERDRLPTLEKQGESLSKGIKLASKALEGFAREHDVEHEWDLRQRRTKSRGDDRGR